jgi:deazaflavin-dependent oxidoreductase (nitroreductase family)
MNNKAITPYSAKQEKIANWVMRQLARWQAPVYELSGGRLWRTFMGVPVAILTTVGRKSGKLRKTPLLYLRDGERIVMTASKAGTSTLPAWYFNAKAAGRVQIQIGADKRDYYVREASLEEERKLWPKLDAIYPDYRQYRARTEGVRRIPILIFNAVQA